MIPIPCVRIVPVKIRPNGLARMSVMSFVLLAAFAHGAPEHGPDWLNDHGAQTIKWLEERNSQTLTQLRADPRFATFESAAADILTDPGRLTPVTFMGDHVYQYWQTRDRPFGVWRRTRRAEHGGLRPRRQHAALLRPPGRSRHQRRRTPRTGGTARTDRRCRPGYRVRVTGLSPGFPR